MSVYNSMGIILREKYLMICLKLTLEEIPFKMFRVRVLADIWKQGVQIDVHRLLRVQSVVPTKYILLIR